MEGKTPAREGPPNRSAFARFVPTPTRWSDNDVYGHINNVVYFSYFDTAVNFVFVEAGLLDPRDGAVIGLVAETSCRFYSELAFPDAVEIGITVEKLGNSSVVYRVAAFKAGAESASAEGRFVHVYVERSKRRPITIPEPQRRLMESLRPPAS